MSTANRVDYIVIVLYALLMVRVGFYVLRFNRGAAEYFRGGSRIPWLVAALSCFMSGFSAWTFTGAAGVAYRSGIAAIGLYIGNALSFLLGYFIFAERWRRSRITTVMEYLAERFNLATHQVFSWTTIVFQLFTSASTLFGLSLFVSAACGFPVTWTIVGAGALIVFYPVLPSLRAALPKPSEAAYAVASLTLLPHGLIGVMLAAMFSSTMATLSAQFNLKSAILTKDMYQALFRKGAGDRELLAVGWISTFLIGGATTAIAILMASSGQSVFQVMLTFNTLMSLAYGPPALLGLAVRRTPPWSGLASFATGLVLGILGAFVYHWTLIQQVTIIIPSSFSVFFLSMLLDRGDWPARERLCRNLNTPVDVGTELKDSPDFTGPVFRFLSRSMCAMGGLSLLLLFDVPSNQRLTVIWFALLTLAVGGSLFFIRGNPKPTANATHHPEEVS